MTRQRLPGSPTGYRTVVEQSPQWEPRTPATGEPSLLGEVLSLRKDVTELRSEVAALKAANRSETTKLIVGGLVTVALAFAGGRAATPAPEATTTVIHRSPFDKALDACRKLESAPERTDCVTKVLQQSVNGPP